MTYGIEFILNDESLGLKKFKFDSATEAADYAEGTKKLLNDGSTYKIYREEEDLNNLECWVEVDNFGDYF